MKSQSLITFLASLALTAAAVIRSPGPVASLEKPAALTRRAVAMTPSIAPQVIFQGPRLGNAFGSRSDRQAAISNEKSSIFRFLMTERLTTTQRCALEFRMPSCWNLPQGYPCYKWSGLLNEASNSQGFHTMPSGDIGWVITFSDDNRLATDWITQVYPGAVVEVGTFDCPAAGSTVDFLIQNDRGLQLEFQQGVDNGVGFWVVPKP